MECYTQTISVSLSLKLKPVDAKVYIFFFIASDMWTVHCARLGGTKGKFG